jgi:hypothetical protein
MVYDFVAKIRGIKDDTMLSMDLVDENLSEISEKIGKHLKVEITPPDSFPALEVFVKSEASVSSMPGYHETELEEAKNIYKALLNELAQILDGEISENDAFFNNSKTFGKLYT